MRATRDDSSSTRLKTGPKRLRLVRWTRRVMMVVAALPLLQTTGCYPDLIAGLSYELQMFVNNFVINTANIIIQNILNL